MTKLHSDDGHIRKRLVLAVDGGMSWRSATRRFRDFRIRTYINGGYQLLHSFTHPQLTAEELVRRHVTA
jgi:hypothetical protein